MLLVVPVVEAPRVNADVVAGLGYCKGRLFHLEAGLLLGTIFQAVNQGRNLMGILGDIRSLEVVRNFAVLGGSSIFGSQWASEIGEWFAHVWVVMW